MMNDCKKQSKKISYMLIGAVLMCLFLTSSGGCRQMNDGAEETHARESSEGHLALGGAEKKSENMSEPFSGKVVETIDAGRYTYVQVDTGEKAVWVASLSFDAEPGDAVSVPPGLPMADFQSKALNRTFDMIYFVGAIHREGDSEASHRQAEMPKDHPPIGDRPDRQMAHPPMSALPESSALEIGPVEKAEGGQTVAEIITGRENLAGKSIRVRAKVVKFTPNIMDKNWLHVRDGSGGEGTNDLIVTTDAVVGVGDVVLIEGVVSVDRDFGYGLKYRVIIEDAEVMIE